MFQPGIESLPYIMDQIPENLRPRVYVRCLAQTIDPDDFVHVWGMERWMAHYERMVNEFATVLATNEEMVAHMRVAGWTAPIYNISGLSFGKSEVQERVGGEIRPFDHRAHRVVFAARWDQEKQPDFFMDVIDAWYSKYPKTEVEFSVLSGGPLRSNNSSYMERTNSMVEQGRLRVYEDLDKNSYYEILNDSRVLFNCALQDWVSNTVSEADALGCNVVYPAYRSFPEVFANDWTRLYVPWSIEDAVKKVEWWLAAPHPHQGRISDWNDGTIDRMLDIMEGQGEQWLRSGTDYRRHTRTNKF
jgi:glycosyltransferase involved in cell wall biosynthesis